MAQFVVVRLSDGTRVHLVERVLYASGARWVIRRRWRAPDAGRLM